MIVIPLKIVLLTLLSFLLLLPRQTSPPPVRTRGMDHRDPMSVDFERALDLDARRRAVDDAKKRGAAQRCDYDAFHQLVLGANLKPFKGPAASWLGQLNNGSSSYALKRRSCAAKRPSTSQARSELSTRVDSSALTAPPRGVDDFSRTWRRLGDDDAAKARYLLDVIPIDAFERIFKVRRRIIFVMCVRSRVN